MKEMVTVDELVKTINANYKNLKSILAENYLQCAWPVRACLEQAVKIFWLKKYDRIPVWVTDNKEKFNLCDAISDERFSNYFNKFLLSHMHNIRITCNEIIHDVLQISKEQMSSMIMLLDSSLKAIEDAIPMIIIESYDAQIPNAEIKNVEKRENAQKVVTSNSTSKDTPVLPDTLTKDLIKGFGGRAQPIYISGCKKFGWDSAKTYLFGRQRSLYATNATNEGYSVWFLSHSNLSNSKGGKWRNTIFEDKIEERWESPDDRLFNDKFARVTFAKTNNSTYVFLGVFKTINVSEEMLNGKKVWVKTYRLISDKYPN